MSLRIMMELNLRKDFDITKKGCVKKFLQSRLHHYSLDKTFPVKSDFLAVIAASF